ncbi:uncharacterized protein C21orf58 homolog isoform X2 [Antechinus flavipes]|uniref:uncharacterized protein C21orf58 homolog isoform X2 n=1 Tax=Antechinus flavipes TaxID=38775 RepID=UPI002235A400|nr:uncharacterized protein C21orf58 homolog isoform X2 [Antechinus flavipes]
MVDSSVADQMARLKLKLLEKKLEAERENMEENLEPSLAAPRSYEGEDEIVQSALRRRKDLLHKLREQHLLEELAGPYSWGGSPRRSYRAEGPPEGPPAPIYPPFPAASQPEQPRIIQQTVPQPPATIIQQLPQQPLITQIPPAPAYAGPRSGSIKEDMVEMMLMQNAQMHQIIMQNMMLKVLPPVTSAAPEAPWLRPAQQEPQFLLRAEKPRTSSVHHHHHYGPPGLPALPAPGPPVGYPLWPSLLPAPAVTQAPGLQPAIRHMMGPTTTVPALNTLQWSPPGSAPRLVSPLVPHAGPSEAARSSRRPRGTPEGEPGQGSGGTASPAGYGEKEHPGTRG